MKAKQGYIIMNTGAPVSTQKVDQQRYLKEVSKDHHVTDLPSVMDTALHPHRADQTATTYNAVWTEYGAPLPHTCKLIRNALRERTDAPVELGMIYDEHSIILGIGKLLDAGVEDIGVLPMFPQYSTETFQSCIDKVREELRKRKSSVLMHKADPFYYEPVYFNPLGEALSGTKEHVLFNYRGLSLHHLKKPDKHGHCMSAMECCNEPSAVHDTCYRFQCLKTTRLIAHVAGLPEKQYTISFQSHHGPTKCIEPYTVDVLKTLAQHGHARLVVINPSHFCDNVETLEEIEQHGKEIFMNAGGERFRMLPCLNNSEAGIRCLEFLLTRSDSWPIA